MDYVVFTFGLIGLLLITVQITGTLPHGARLGRSRPVMGYQKRK